MSERDALTEALLELHGRSPAEEIGFTVGDEPDALFRLLVAVLLFSARIDAPLAVAAGRALGDEGWNEAGSLRDAGWEARTRVLSVSGYARYDESTSRMLGDTWCELLLERYDGDLRSLRDAAEREPAAERRRLKGVQGCRGRHRRHLLPRGAGGLTPWRTELEQATKSELGERAEEAGRAARTSGGGCRTRWAPARLSRPSGPGWTRCRAAS